MTNPAPRTFNIVPINDVFAFGTSRYRDSDLLHARKRNGLEDVSTFIVLLVNGFDDGKLILTGNFGK